MLRLFDVSLVFFDPLISEETAKEWGVRKISIDELISRSDVITVHKTGLEYGYNPALIKEDAVFIHIERFSPQEEQTLIKELERGHISAFINQHSTTLLSNLKNVTSLPTSGGHRLYGSYMVREVHHFLRTGCLACHISNNSDGFIQGNTNHISDQYNKKKIKVAILIDKRILHQMLHNDDIAYLRSFADINNPDDLPEVLDEAFVLNTIKDAQVCIIGWRSVPFNEKILQNAPELKLIAHTASSLKRYINQSVWTRNIRVFSATPVMALDVAETILGLIINHLKRIGRFNTLTDPRNVSHNMLYGDMTIGVIAASTIGKYLIEMLNIFNAHMIVYDPYLSDSKAEELGVHKVSLDELMRKSDIVTLNAPKTHETLKMINAQNLSLMKDNSLFINTARGALVDEQALIDILKTGRISACIDVTDPTEPLAYDHPFHQLDNVFLIPHIAGGHADNGRFQQGSFVIQEIFNFFQSSKLKYEVTKKMLEISA